MSTTAPLVQDLSYLAQTPAHKDGIAQTVAVGSPSHPSLIEVIRRPGAFTSGAFSLVSLPPGALFARITTATPAPAKAYTSVQISPTEHVELNSDLVYCNHSCEPTVVFDMSQMAVRVVPDRPLKIGDPLTFFYPSTEWNMAQPFTCTCGTVACKGWIQGAERMPQEVLDAYWLNPHIEALLAAREKSNR
ncbi:MAG: hypothetical protein M1838_000522 [Thelocarpon superellum]|nr:MAG: hypothetical protein M1838_000522 [Thelocarpon superellum]